MDWKKLVDFLNAFSNLNDREFKLAMAILYREFDYAEHLCATYDREFSKRPSWGNAFWNASDPEVGRTKALEDMAGNFLTEGEI